MWKKWKESEFFKKMKEVRVNRAVYLTAVVILLALAVVLAITAATNRAKKNDLDPLPSESLTQSNTPSSTPDGGTDSQPTVNEDVIPQLTLPVSGKLSKSHSVDVQVFSQTLQEWRTHLGIDIATEKDAPVCAMASGKVERIWEDPLMGWCVAISHSGECLTVYKNLASDMAQGIAVGADVQSGQLLGYVGDSAQMELADEPHLHMEMTVKGLQVDPLDYFSTEVLNMLTGDTASESGNGK